MYASCDTRRALPPTVFRRKGPTATGFPRCALVWPRRRQRVGTPNRAPLTGVLCQSLYMSILVPTRTGPRLEAKTESDIFRPQLVTCANQIGIRRVPRPSPPSSMEYPGRGVLSNHPLSTSDIACMSFPHGAASPWHRVLISFTSPAAWTRSASDNDTHWGSAYGVCLSV